MNNPAKLTSGRLVARNTIINLGGEIVPFLVAVLALRVLIHSIGVDRYGDLTLSMLTLSLPFVISGGSLSGTLAAFQRFDLINAVSDRNHRFICMIIK